MFSFLFVFLIKNSNFKQFVSGGWFGAAESSKDKEAIVTLLRPDGGQFFRMLIERGQDRYCDFPVDKLPVSFFLFLTLV